MLTATILSTLSIPDVGLEVRLIDNQNGTYNVTLFDMDANQIVGGRCRIADRAKAEAYAAELFASNS